MNDADAGRSLDQARAFLWELGEDEREAPAEFATLVSAFARRMADLIVRFKDGLLEGRELDAHVFQVRLTYSRELQRLLPSEPPPEPRWVRTA